MVRSIFCLSVSFGILLLLLLLLLLLFLLLFVLGQTERQITKSISGANQGTVLILGNKISKQEQLQGKSPKSLPIADVDNTRCAPSACTA